MPLQNLKPGSALLLEALHRHGKHGSPPTAFTAHKLVYFLQQMGGPFGTGVTFAGSKHGPLSPAVDVALRALNGSYLAGVGTGADALFAPLTVLPASYPAVRRYIVERLTASQAELLNHLDALLEGHRGVFALEVLSTVHLVRKFYTQDNFSQVTEITRGWLQRPVEEVRTWHVAAAVRRLDEFAGLLAFGT